MESQAYNITEILKHGLIALLAGLAHALNNDYSKGTIWQKVGEFVASVLIASFSGVIFGLVALEMFGQGSYLTLAITGSGGFIGAKGLKMISETMLDTLKVVVSKKHE